MTYNKQIIMNAFGMVFCMLTICGADPTSTTGPIDFLKVMVKNKKDKNRTPVYKMVTSARPVSTKMTSRDVLVHVKTPSVKASRPPTTTACNHKSNNNKKVVMDDAVVQKLCSVLMHVATMTTATDRDRCSTLAKAVSKRHNNSCPRNQPVRKVFPPPTPINVVAADGSLSPPAKQSVDKYKDPILFQETNGAADYPITYPLEKKIIGVAAKGSNKDDGDRDADKPHDVWKTVMVGGHAIAKLPKSQTVDESDYNDEET